MIRRRPGRRFQPSFSGSRVYADTHTHAALKRRRERERESVEFSFFL